MDREFRSSRIIFHLSVCILNFGRGIYEMVVTTDRRMMNYAMSLLENDLEDLYNMKLYLQHDKKGIVEVTVNGEQSCRMVTSDAIEWVKERITQVKRGIKYWESAKEGK